MSKAPALGIVIQSGQVDRVHYGLLFAAGAAAVGRALTLFFTMDGCRALAGRDHLLPAGDGRTAAAYDSALAEKGIAGFAELWESLEALGARFQACDSGLVYSDITAPEGVEVTGVVGFLGDVGTGAQIIYI